ncbi:MAG: hypothetical protein ACXVX7_09220 [Mycobacterium sp.]
MPRPPARVAAYTIAGVVGPPDIGAATSGMDIPNCGSISKPFPCRIVAGVDSAALTITTCRCGSIPPGRPTWQDASA